jgi:nitroreductase
MTDALPQFVPSPLEAVRCHMNRREFLKRAGIGAGAVLIVAGAGTTWRAVDQGVFATDEGVAYQAWGAWDAPTDAPLLPLVRAAVLAANAHDTQPWLFALGANRVDLFADLARTIGALDPLRRELYLSLGCALENLTLAARARGFTPAITLLPTPGDATHVARVDLTPGAAVISPLYTAIPQRHTNRGAYDTARVVEASVLAALGALATDPDTAVVWLTTAASMRQFADLTLRATAAIIADPEQARDDFAWWRGDWQAIQAHKDGITLDPAGLPTLTRALGKILPAQALAAYDQAWLDGMRDRQVGTAAAFGLLVARDGGDNAQRLAAGQLWQRLHLSATTQGLAMQPLCQVPERIDREQATGGAPVITRAFAGLLPTPGSQAVMAFRIGYPTLTAHLSPRRPAEEVLRP